MLKNKFSTVLLAGVALLSGAIGGSALIASAQRATASNIPVVTSSTNSAQSSVDKQESANDSADTESAIEAPEGASGKADTDNVQAGPGSTLEQVGEHHDADGGSQSEANEPAGSADVSEQ